MTLDRTLVVRILPFAVFVAFIALDGVLSGIAERLEWDPRWWYALRTGAVAALLAWFWREYGELGLPTVVSLNAWFLAVAMGVAVFVLWINLDFKPLALGNPSGYDPRTASGGIDWGLATTRLAGAALVVPVMEELFWRSFVMRWVHKPDFLKVAPAQVGWKALAVSSALFALEHHLWFAGLLAGLAYGWLFIRTGTLWTGLVAHAVTNALLGVWVLYTGQWRFW